MVETYANCVTGNLLPALSFSRFVCACICVAHNDLYHGHGIRGHTTRISLLTAFMIDSTVLDTTENTLVVQCLEIFCLQSCCPLIQLIIHCLCIH